MIRVFALVLSCRRVLALAALWFFAASGVVQAGELVRVRISQFTGSEPQSVDSATHPELFALDGAIASAELRATNPAGDFKGNDGAGNFFPSMAPAPPAAVAGTIELVITPNAGSPIVPGGVRFATAALFASNPSSFVLRWSKDSFASALSIIDLAAPTISTVALGTPASDEQVVLRWVAGNDFGEFGGGEAGFSAEDIVVATDASFPPGGCDAAPVSGCLDPGKASVKLTSPANPQKRASAWSWKKGTTDASELGDPTVATAYRFCVYDDGALVTGAALLPGGTCGEKPCWKKTKAGAFVYRDKAARADGIVAAKLKPGTGKAAVRVRGHGSKLALPLPLVDSQAVVVQLVRTDAPTCWNATFPAPAKKSTANLFKDALP
jgi:hypothetical protein